MTGAQGLKPHHHRFKSPRAKAGAKAEDWPALPVDLVAQPSLLGRRSWSWLGQVLLVVQSVALGLSLAAVVSQGVHPLPRLAWAAIVVVALAGLIDLLERLQGRTWRLWAWRLRARGDWREALSLSQWAALVASVSVLSGAAQSPLLWTLGLGPVLAGALLPKRVSAAVVAHSALLASLLWLRWPELQAWPQALGSVFALVLVAVVARLSLFAGTRRAQDRAAVDSGLRLQRLLDDARAYRLTGARGGADPQLKRPLSAALSVRENMSEMTELAHRALRPRATLMWWLDEDEDFLTLRSQRGPGELVKLTKVPASQGLMASVLKRQDAVNLHGLAQDFAGLPFYHPGQRPRAVLAVPLLEGEYPRGVLLVDRSDEATQFSAQDEVLLASLAKQIVHSVEVERVFALMDKDQHSQEALLRLTEQLNAALSLEASLDALVQGVLEIANAELAAVVLQENKRVVVSRLLGPVAPESLRGVALAPSGSLVLSAMRSQATLPARADLLAGEKAISLFGDKLDPKGLRRGKVIPLVHQGESIGALVLASTQRNSLGDEIVRMLQVAAGYGAISLVNARLFARMEHMATRDGLTGLINHRSFQEQLAGALARSLRFDQALTLMLCDIDHFKQVNDTYGHPIGDEVLRRVSAVLTEASRTTDVVARYGGEEFTVIMEATDREGAMIIAERIRRTMEAMSLETQNGTLQVTLSAGLATFPHDAEQQADLIKAADETLYLAKNQGRNRCLHRRHTRGHA